MKIWSELLLHLKAYKNHILITFYMKHAKATFLRNGLVTKP